MLSRLQWHNVKIILEIKVLVFIHKIVHLNTPKYFENCTILSSNIHSHNTRNKDNIYIEHKNTKQGQNTIFFKAMIVYNKLPRNIKNINSTKTFKQLLVQSYYNRN